MPDYPSGLVYDPEIRAMEAVAFTDYTSASIYDPAVTGLETAVLPPPVPPDPAPVVALLGPVPQSLELETPLRFTVTGATIKTIIWVYYAGLRLEEVVWDGTAFTPAYANGSSRAVAGTLQTFSVRRVPAWPEAPVLRVFAASAGGEAT